MTAEELISYIEDECTDLSDEIIELACKRVIEMMNKDYKNLELFSSEYPANFTFFDKLSIEWQTKEFDEMVDNYGIFSRYIEDTLDLAIDSLTPVEKTILSYTNFREAGSSFSFEIRDDLSSLIMMRLTRKMNQNMGLCKVRDFMEKYGD